MARNKKARYKKAILYPLFEAYAQGGESREDFCKRHGLGVHNYNYWWAKYRKDQGIILRPKKGDKKMPSNPVSVCAAKKSRSSKSKKDKSNEHSATFLPVELDHPSPVPCALRLSYGSAFQLEFSSLPPVNYLKTLLTPSPKTMNDDITKH